MLSTLHDETDFYLYQVMGLKNETDDSYVHTEADRVLAARIWQSRDELGLEPDYSKAWVVEGKRLAETILGSKPDQSKGG